MEANKKVYMLVMRFHKNHKNGDYEKENSGTIHYTKEAALEELQNYLQSELWYFKNDDHKTEKASVKDLIYEMHTEKCSCELFINEYSCRRERFFSQKELHQRFQEVILNPSENLYDDLLSLVDHQRYYVNSFGEITRVITIPQKIEGKEISVGNFTEEDCKNGFYGGDFKYMDGTAEEERKEYDRNLYFGSVNMLRKNIGEKNRTGWERYKECFFSEEEALQGALAFYNDKLEEYVSDGIGDTSKNLLKDIARKNVIQKYISVCVVSPERNQFSTIKEMKQFYTDNILKAESDERYDFLLSLVKFDERFYDESGVYLRSENNHQCLEDDYYRILPKFSKENAKFLNYNV